MSADAVGAQPAANKPTRLSMRSASEHRIPAGLSGLLSPACLGSTLSKIACRGQKPFKMGSRLLLALFAHFLQGHYTVESGEMPNWPS